jgi:hypothetical protein
MGVPFYVARIGKTKPFFAQEDVGTRLHRCRLQAFQFVEQQLCWRRKEI